MRASSSASSYTIKPPSKTSSPVPDKAARKLARHAVNATGLAPGDYLDAALLVSLLPGNYTAIVRGSGETSGVALVEIYDLKIDN